MVQTFRCGNALRFTTESVKPSSAGSKIWHFSKSHKTPELHRATGSRRPRRQMSDCCQLLHSQQIKHPGEWSVFSLGKNREEEISKEISHMSWNEMRVLTLQSQWNRGEERTAEEQLPNTEYHQISAFNFFHCIIFPVHVSLGLVVCFFVLYIFHSHCFKRYRDTSDMEWEDRGWGECFLIYLWLLIINVWMIWWEKDTLLSVCWMHEYPTVIWHLQFLCL